MARQETITADEYTYTVVLERDAASGVYTVTVPALPGCVTEGKNLADARAQAREAIQGYLESLQKDGVPFPASEEPDDDVIRDRVSVKLVRA